MNRHALVIALLIFTVACGVVFGVLTLADERWVLGAFITLLTVGWAVVLRVNVLRSEGEG